MERILADGLTGGRKLHGIQARRIAEGVFRYGGNGGGGKVYLTHFAAVHKGFFCDFRYTRKFGCAYGTGRIQLAAAFQTLHDALLAAVCIQSVNNGIVRCEVRTATEGNIFQYRAVTERTQTHFRYVGGKGYVI